MSDDQITKAPETPIVKQKDPKKVAAGKKLAEYHRNAKKALEKSAEDEPSSSWMSKISLTTAVTLFGLGLTAVDLYFRWKKVDKPPPVVERIPKIESAPAKSRTGME